MIIVNGTIEAKIKTGGGLDENGNPIPSSNVWGAPIPCNISVNKKSNLGKQNGNTFTIASYGALIPLQPFDAGIVRLTHYGQSLGEFPVMHTELLNAVGATKITV